MSVRSIEIERHAQRVIDHAERCSMPRALASQVSELARAIGLPAQREDLVISSLVAALESRDRELAQLRAIVASYEKDRPSR